MTSILVHWKATFGVSFGMFMLAALFTVTRSRFSILRRYSIARNAVSSSDCKKCVVCKVEIYGLCNHHQGEHDWCRCIWR
jgi:hypothetical protein